MKKGIRQEQWDTFLKGLRLGLSVTDACANVSMTRDTVYKRARRDPGFSAELDKAILEPKMRAILRVVEAGKTHWQAAAWMLERKYRDEYALRTEHTGPSGQPIEIKVVNYALPSANKPTRKL